LVISLAFQPPGLRISRFQGFFQMGNRVFPDSLLMGNRVFPDSLLMGNRFFSRFTFDGKQGFSRLTFGGKRGMIYVIQKTGRAGI